MGGPNIISRVNKTAVDFVIKRAEHCPGSRDLSGMLWRLKSAGGKTFDQLKEERDAAAASSSETPAVDTPPAPAPTAAAQTDPAQPAPANTESWF